MAALCRQAHGESNSPANRSKFRAGMTSAISSIRSRSCLWNSTTRSASMMLRTASGSRTGPRDKSSPQKSPSKAARMVKGFRPRQISGSPHDLRFPWGQRMTSSSKMFTTHTPAARSPTRRSSLWAPPARWQSTTLPRETGPLTNRMSKLNSPRSCRTTPSRRTRSRWSRQSQISASARIGQPSLLMVILILTSATKSRSRRLSPVVADFRWRRIPPGVPPSRANLRRSSSRRANSVRGEHWGCGLRSSSRTPAFFAGDWPGSRMTSCLQFSKTFGPGPEIPASFSLTNSLSR